jgi:Ni,Fe-hydrogenase III small subunit/formate hydrogenlyase subunit 6/NADH:ubiquinone oxidoreductase subunit I
MTFKEGRIMYNIVKKFIQHGIVTVNYPKKPIVAGFVTGRPVVDDKKCKLCATCIKQCPTQALSLPDKREAGIRVSLDRCLFCTICEEVCPHGAMRMSSQFELAETNKDHISDGARMGTGGFSSDAKAAIISQKLNKSIYKQFGRSLQIREVDAGSCNGCDNEANALNGPYNDIERLRISFVASPRHADMLLVTGPVTKNMELALIKTYEATPDPKLVMAVGSCSCSGGIFAGSYAAKNGVDSVLPVDVYVPGCPPRPQAIIYGILKAIERKK